MHLAAERIQAVEPTGIKQAPVQNIERCLHDVEAATFEQRRQFFGPVDRNANLLD